MRQAVRVSAIEDVTPGVRLIRFFSPEHPIELPVGSHVDFEIPGTSGDQRRSYSIVHFSADDRELRIAVKRVDLSRGGSRFMWSLRPGMEIVMVGVANSLPLSFTAAKYVLLAGGIGVTPLIGIAHSLKRANKDLRMVYCAKTRSDAAFASHLEESLDDRFVLAESAGRKRLDVRELIAEIDAQTQLYLCGPLSLMDSVKREWKNRALPPANLRFETFASSGGFPVTGFTLNVVENGLKLDVAPDQTILDALLNAGIDVMCHCLKGECGLCKLNVVSVDGAIDHRDVFLGDAEKAANSSLCCCVSRVSGEQITVSIDQVSYGRFVRAKHNPDNHNTVA